MVVWDPMSHDEPGGCTQQDIARARFILWKGNCAVHMMFKPEHVDAVRAEWPDVKVIVHPECTYEVCRKADMTGSTEEIIGALEDAEPDTRWAIGTEGNMVNRLCRKVAERRVEARILSGCQCLCITMFRIDMPHLLWVMDNLAEGKVVNQITVDPHVAKQAQVALSRMLQINAGRGSLESRV